MYYNHNIRTQIQELKNRLYKSISSQLGHQLKYSLNYLKDNKQIFGIIQEAVIKYPYPNEFFIDFIEKSRHDRPEVNFENEMQHLSFCYQFLTHFTTTYKSYDLHTFKFFIGRDFDYSKNKIIEDYLTPIFNYIHDQLDKSNSTIYLLEKYKKRTEWFTYKNLLDLYKNAKKNFEQIFEDDLRLYLFDQGIDYPFSTPKSTSGRADIIGAIDTDNPIVLEIKVLDKEKSYGKNRIIEGFSQIIKYTNDYNKDIGYLVIFNVDNIEINFDLIEKSNIFPPMITLNNKTYFFVIINLYPNIQASKIGKTSIITITEGELTNQLK